VKNNLIVDNDGGEDFGGAGCGSSVG
jgi:hypothetical protein